MTKQTFSWIGGALLALSLVACGGGNKGGDTTPKPAAADGGMAASPPSSMAPGSGSPCAAGTMEGNK
jgi:hypothetical protein